jgi:alanine racemase
MFRIPNNAKKMSTQISKLSTWKEKTKETYKLLNVDCFKTSKEIKGKTCWVEVNVEHLIQNFDFFQEKHKFLGENTENWPVLKAKAYGHFMETIVPPLAFLMESKNLKPKFCVHREDEAKELSTILKVCGFEDFTISIMSPPYPDQFEDLFDPNFIIQIVDKSSAMEMNQQIEILKEKSILEKNYKQKVSIELNTGMNRLGYDVNSDEKLSNQVSDFVLEMKEIFDCQHLSVETISTHFSVADELKEIEFTRMQLDRLLLCMENLKESGFSIPHLSFANSSCLVLLEEILTKELKERILNLDMKIIGRPGISMYGLPASDEAMSKKLKLVGERIACRIHQIRYLNKGETVSYGNVAVEEDGYYATIPMGYGDGIRRETKTPHVFLVNGKKTKAIGRVCMDQLIVKVDEKCNVGDRALFLGDELTEREVTNRIGSISYTLLTSMPGRPKRIAILE